MKTKSRINWREVQFALAIITITMSLAFLVSCGANKKKQEVVYLPADTYTVVEVIDPCGPEGDKDEVLLRLNNNTIVVPHEGNKNYFYVKAPGQYITRDGTKCTYLINEDGSVDW